MREEVYDFLREYGFTKEELSYFEEVNERMFFTNLMEVNKNIDFLLNKGLVKEEVINVFRNNPFMITVKNNRLDSLDKIYIEELKFSNDDLRNLIINNPKCYTASSVEFDKIINYLMEYKFSVDVIRNFIIENPVVANLSFIEFERYVKIDTNNGN